VEQNFQEPDWDSKNNMTTLIFRGHSAVSTSYERVNSGNEGVNTQNEVVNEGSKNGIDKND